MISITHNATVVKKCHKPPICSEYVDGLLPPCYGLLWGMVDPFAKIDWVVLHAGTPARKNKNIVVSLWQ